MSCVHVFKLVQYNVVTEVKHCFMGGLNRPVEGGGLHRDRGSCCEVRW